MFKRLLEWKIKKVTKNYTRVPLLYIFFDLQHFKKNGKEGSCYANFHPILKEDETIKEMIKNLSNYIRDTYDMEELVK